MAEYIEREAAIAWFMPYVHAGESIEADVVISDLKGMKAADVEPVRRGRWVQVIVHVEVGDGFVDRVKECCSVCHEPNGRRCTYFCPNCGARMNEEAQNER